jgi:hypothetical protein
MAAPVDRRSIAAPDGAADQSIRPGPAASARDMGRMASHRALGTLAARNCVDSHSETRGKGPARRTGNNRATSSNGARTVLLSARISPRDRTADRIPATVTSGLSVLARSHMTPREPTRTPPAARYGSTARMRLRRHWPIPRAACAG